MDAQERQIRTRLRDDFPHYAGKCLKIRAKSASESLGKIVPFTLNRAQLHLHGKLEEQLGRAGKVRALVLKGRQQGCSTYIGGRYYHKTTHADGTKTFILTHRDDATANLFTMVRRFHDHCPELVKASTSYSNRRELIFDKLDSGYALGTAGSGDVGRSDTIDLFHGSEAAFWKNPDDIKAGVLQAAGSAREIIFETTGNGFDAFFYPLWKEAEAGRGEYMPVFIPWFWQPEYVADVPEGMRLEDEEADLQSAYGLTTAQLAWRRNKVAELTERLFRQEYPCTAAEAFQTTGDASLIPVLLVTAAFGRPIGYKSLPTLMGVDIGASMSGDPSSIVFRQGGMVRGLEEFRLDDDLAIAGRIKERYFEQERHPEAICIDAISWGKGPADILRAWGLPVIAVNVSESAASSERFSRLRDELWWTMREFFAQKQCSIQESPLRDKLAFEVSAPTYGYMPNGRIKVESKEDMKKRGISSPNLADALMHTMIYNPKHVEIPDHYFNDDPARSRFV